MSNSEQDLTQFCSFVQYFMIHYDMCCITDVLGYNLHAANLPNYIKTCYI